MKLFASDYDGTLFFDRPYNTQDVEAIARLQKAGHAFILNTGRGYRQIEPHYPWDPTVIRPDLYVCNSGAVIMNPQGEILEEYAIPFDEVEKLVELYPDHPFSFSADGEFVLKRHPYFVRRFNLEQEPSIELIDDVEALRGRSIHSLGIHFDTIEEASQAAGQLRENSSLGIHVNRQNIDVNRGEFDKATGLRAAAALLGAEQTYAVGDSFNDLPALMAADRGFLMDSAPESLQQAARENGIEIVSSVAQAIDQALADPAVSAG